MIRCSYCEQALVCKHCNRPYQARGAEAHVAVYQPDMEVHCPMCEQVLVCKQCGFVYGGEGEEDE
jgi:hypothetical protein